MVDGRIIYDAAKAAGRAISTTACDRNQPGGIYAGFGGNPVSWGYLDDACDGTVSVELAVGGKTFRAFARIGAGPPSFAPDGLADPDGGGRT